MTTRGTLKRWSNKSSFHKIKEYGLHFSDYETIRKALTLLDLVEQNKEGLEAMCWNENMEEAPRDGAYILVKQPHGFSPDTYVVAWDECDNTWYLDNGKSNEIPLRGDDPTAWKPLPDNDTLIKKIMEVL